MSSLTMYCIDLFNDDYQKIKSLGYKPVGLGKNNFTPNWLRDNTGDNISEKNSSYGELTFHYWLWKNKLKEIDDDKWIGFCAYRRFWGQTQDNFTIKYKKDFLNSVPENWNDESVILGQEIYMDGWTPMKIIKHGLLSLVRNEL